MTVTSTQNVVTYTGDGSTTAYAFPYIFYENSHLTVQVAGATQTLDTNYTVSGAGSPSGGTVTFTVAPANAAEIVIQRLVPYTQETDLENFDGNPADVTEKQFDLIVMQAQQLNAENSRLLLLPINNSVTDRVISGTIDGTTRLLTLSNDGPATSTLASVTTDFDTFFTGLNPKRPYSIRRDETGLTYQRLRITFPRLPRL